MISYEQRLDNELSFVYDHDSIIEWILMIDVVNYSN